MLCAFQGRCDHCGHDHGKPFDLPNMASLSETIRQQQSEIERLKSQRDRLLKAGNSILKAMDLCNTEMVYQADFELRALIAEIEASK